MELLVVIGIIGILVLVSLPNIYKIIMMHRIRSSATELLTRARSVRRLALTKRRELQMIVDTEEHTFRVEKPGHTEYDLLKDIAGAILASSETYPNLTAFMLYYENATSLELNVHIGDANNDGYDNMTTTCINKTVSFNPAGTIEPTCSFTLTNSQIDTQYELRMYKGGQIILKRL